MEKIIFIAAITGAFIRNMSAPVIAAESGFSLQVTGDL